MAKSKKGGEPTATTAVSKGQESLAVKKAQRLAQSRKDSAAALNAPGHEPSAKRKEAVVFELHRCRICARPSARVRHKEGEICKRCNRYKNPEWVATREARDRRTAETK
jgi:hypothetical protein